MRGLKRKGLLIVFVLTTTVLCLCSCTGNFNKLNTPRDELTTGSLHKSNIGQLFSNAEFWGMVGNHTTYELMGLLHSGLWSQIYTYTVTTDRYREVDGWVNLSWNEFFGGPALNLHYVLKLTSENNLPVEHAIAKIWKVVTYEKWTDYFGPIPFSEYGNGKTSVKFDSQKEIYYSSFKILDNAINILEKNMNGVPFGDNDLIYSGNVRKWIKFANSIRLRLAIRISYVEPSLAKKQAEKAVSDGVFTSNSDNATIPTDNNNLNYLSYWSYAAWFCMSATEESILKGFKDPRMKVFWNNGGALTGGNKGYNGIRNGMPEGLTVTSWVNTYGASYVGQQFLPLNKGGINHENVVMTAAQVDFDRAEGALRGWSMGGTAEHFYNQGIRHSLEYWTQASEDEVNAYIINSKSKPVGIKKSIVPGANWKTPPESNITVKFEQSADFETKLEQIITQKWIDDFLTPWDAWAARRRTGYPRGYAIVQSLNPNISVTAIMRRVKYPSEEYDNNGKAINQAVSKYLNGKDLNMTRLWWDKKPLSKYPDLSNSVVAKYSNK
jgi:hypothetical protein